MTFSPICLYKKTPGMQINRTPPTNPLKEFSSYSVDTGFLLLKHFKGSKNLLFSIITAYKEVL
jgi:hypothetical protein